MEEKFVERLKELIEREGITQKNLAYDVGVTEAAISRYMKGDRIPHGETLCNLATSLHTTIDYLLGNVDNENFNEEISFDQMKGLLARSSKGYSSAENDELLRIILNNK